MRTLHLLLMLLTVAEGFSASATAQVGQSVEIVVTSQGTPPLVIAWLKNGVPIAGATSATLSISQVAKSDEGEYSATVANAAGSTLSDSARLTIIPMQATLTANVTSANYPGPTLYVWRRDGKTIPGANQSTYVFDPQAAPGSYSVSVTWPNVMPVLK